MLLENTLLLYSFLKMLSDDKDVLDAVNLLNILNAYEGSRVHNYWVHPFWRQNCNDRGAYAVFKDLEDDDRFQFLSHEKKKLLIYSYNCFHGGLMTY